MKILVTGGAGYIGSAVSSMLLKAGHEVVVYDNLSTGFREAIPAGAKFVFGDIRDPALPSRIMKDEKIEAVMHFAAKLVVPESLLQPLEYYDVNVMGGLNLARACLKQGVRSFIFSSTAAVYGTPRSTLASEDEPVHALNPYGASKAMVEKILTDFGQTHDFRSVCLRYFNVAGAMPERGQRTKNATHLIKVAAETACGKRPEMAVYGTDYQTRDGSGVRDYIHIEDLAEAHILALRYLQNGGESRILNCGYGKGYSVLQVIETMKAVSGVDFKVRHEARRAGDAAEVVADSSRISKLFDWQPSRADLVEICRSAYEWEKSLV